MTDGDDGYGGVFGAFPYAFRATDSLLCKSYVALGGLAALLLTLLFGLALVTLFGATAQARFSIVRAFYVLVGLGAVGPTIVPVLLVARSRRRKQSRKPGYEAGLALAGYAFLASLYAGAVVGAEATPLPPVAGLAFPLTGGLLIVAAHYVRR
ncbi:hypothetical protein [Halobaculum gomorrense]|uniref:DUF8056 domain-containing protein n=1 Tax=Halobaculum gomorrense TaxID=43928 RepID=A0A1M5M080_9EURY|nr:hypothetical protein [Halobaculum gomorrense]SHG70742.1 hypothetical protein SAMN05443636_0841 [Halobaculum gomorrense]